MMILLSMVPEGLVVGIFRNLKLKLVKPKLNVEQISFENDLLLLVN